MENFDKFIEMYAEELKKAVTEYPLEYAFPPTMVLTVVDKMGGALKSGSYNKDSRAIKAVCKRLGIKHTYTAINQFLRS